MIRSFFLLSLLTSLIHSTELKQINDRSLAMNWDDANAYCSAKEGWRLPTIQELFALAIADKLILKNRNYWSATPFIRDKNRKWQVLSYFGDVKPLLKGDKLMVACVPNTPITPAIQKRFSLTEAGLIHDQKTDLFWQPISKKERRHRYTFQEAQSYCASLKLDGKTWRLPTRKEYMEIVDYTQTKPALSKPFFKNTAFKYYWTGEFLENYSNEAFVSGLKIGTFARSSKINKSFVRCVSMP